MPPLPTETDPPVTEDHSLVERVSVFSRSPLKIILTGSELESDAEAALQAPIKLPKMPIFTSFGEERLHRKQRLAAGFRLWAKYGLDEGVAGHMTCRDPEHPGLFWVNPFGMHFGQIRASDLILVDHEGNLVRGSRAVNKAAYMIHSRVHEARPDAVAACHTHSMYGRTFSTLGRKLLPITQDACAFWQDHAIYDDYTGVVLEDDEGTKIGKALGNNKAVILQNHGLLTVGKTIEEAVWWFISMERCCQTQLLAEAACKNGVDDIKVVTDEHANETHKTVGTPQAGWFMAQPMFDMIISEQPMCLQ